MGVVKRHKKEIESKQKFDVLLEELSNKHRIFSKYMIENLIKEYQIEKSELKLLIISALKRKLIKEVKKDYFQIVKIES